VVKVRLDTVQPSIAVAIDMRRCTVNCIMYGVKQ
jgi:hypothetical protein